MIRTTFLSTTTGATQRLMERSAAADRASARLASGRAFSRASEDPAAATTALALRGELGALPRATTRSSPTCRRSWDA
jgi:flagellin-like hook-associated protein FlgL